MKPLVSIDKEMGCIRIDSNVKEQIDITEAHSFLKDFIRVIYDYHKLYPINPVGNYIGDQNGR